MKPSQLMLSLVLAVWCGGGALISTAHAADEDDRRVIRSRDVAPVDPNKELAAAAEASRLKSITLLKDLLSKGVEGDTKAEMMLRLADLYFDQGRYLYLNEMGAFDEEQGKCWNDATRSDCDKMQPNTEESRGWQEKAIRLYQSILKSYPRYARADEATYYLASALTDIGQAEEGLEQYTNLVRQYPDSLWVPDSYVAIGEYEFEHEQAYKALLAYKKATAYPDSDMFGFALYKLAWCYYNVGEYGDAIDTMKRVQALGGAEDKSKLKLSEEALTDLVRFFADADRLEDAEVYFRSLGKPELYLKALKRIGATFFEQGKWDQAVAVYRKLIAENPNAPEAVGYQVEIIRAYKKLQKRDEILTEVTSLLKTYGKTSAWAKANAANPEALKGADESIELQVRTAAVEYHEYARKLKGGEEAKTYYALAYKSYKLYLDAYAENSHAYEMHYAFGELLYKVKRYDEAYDHYMAVVKINPKGERSKFCAESAIFSADEQIKKEAAASGTTAPTAPSKEAIPLTEWEQKLVDACKQFATLFPGDQKNIAIIYRSAYLLYNRAHYSEAAEQFNTVIVMDPKSQQAMDASHLMLDQFKIQENWAELKKNAKFYYEQPGLGTSTFKAEVHTIYERASFKLIEVTLASDKDKGKAADGFMAFYDEFPTSEVAAQALNNATVYYSEVARPGDAIKARKILIDDPKFGPKTKYYYDQIGALGYDYETIADFASAATYYEKLFSLYPKQLATVQKDAPDKADALTKQAGDALYSAAVFRKASGGEGWTKAIEDYKQFVAAFPADARAEDVRLTIGKIWEEQKRYTEAAAVYYGYYSKATKETSPDFLYFARLRHGKMLEAQGQKAKAAEVYKESVDLYKKSGLPPGAYTEFVAEMMFIQAQPKFDKYMLLKITGSGSTSSQKAENTAIEKSLKAKAAALVDVEKSYGEIITTGAGQWGLAALVQLGQVYENMGETLKTSAIPYYLDADQRQMYGYAIDDKVYPQVQKAIAAYSTALSKAYELTLYDDNTALATRRLGILDPENYPGLSETLSEPHATSSTAKRFDFEKEL